MDTAQTPSWFRLVVEYRLEAQQLQSGINTCPSRICETRIVSCPSEISSMEHTLRFMVNTQNLAICQYQYKQQ